VVYEVNLIPSEGGELLEVCSAWSLFSFIENTLNVTWQVTTVCLIKDHDMKFCGVSQQLIIYLGTKLVWVVKIHDPTTLALADDLPVTIEYKTG
jgi:hypothetical protein